MIELADRLPGLTHTGRRMLIFNELDMSPSRYWQLVNSLIDDQDARAAYPATLSRLEELRHTRRQAR